MSGPCTVTVVRAPVKVVKVTPAVKHIKVSTAGPAGRDAGPFMVQFTKQGALSIVPSGAGNLPLNAPHTLMWIVGALTTPAVGDTVFDVLINGVSGFTNPLGRPRILSGDTVSAQVTPDNNDLVAGDLLTGMIAVVGSPPGTTLVINVGLLPVF